MEGVDAFEYRNLKQQNSRLREEMLALKQTHLLNLDTLSRHATQQFSALHSLSQAQASSLKSEHQAEIALLLQQHQKQTSRLQQDKLSLKQRIRELSQQLLSAQIQKEQLIQQQWHLLKEIRQPFTQVANESSRYNELLQLYSALVSQHNQLKKKVYRKEVDEKVVYQPKTTNQKSSKRRTQSSSKK